MTVLTGLRVVTCDAQNTVYEPGAVAWNGERIVYVGPAEEAPTDNHVLHHPGVVTPGLIDAHTHTPWAGTRHHEYVMRVQGASYQELQAAGGGILSTHHAVARVSEAELLAQTIARLRAMRLQGVTTVECKSGYGLLPDLEHKQLLALEAAARTTGLPAVVPTFLGLHAVPKGADRKQYVDTVIQVTLPRVAKLARFVDAYVDEHAFTVEEARRFGAAAKKLGLGVRMHVGQFSDIGAAELAAELGALSCDHLEHLGEAGIRAMASMDVAAVILPTARWVLAQKERPPIEKLRAAGVRLVVASDANPGTAPTQSLPLAMAIALRNDGLTPEEIWQGVTCHAARALGIFERTGSLEVGKRADIVAWNFAHENALLQPWGTSQAAAVWVAGNGLSDLAVQVQ